MLKLVWCRPDVVLARAYLRSFDFGINLSGMLPGLLGLNGSPLDAYRRIINTMLQLKRLCEVFLGIVDRCLNVWNHYSTLIVVAMIV